MTRITKDELMAMSRECGLEFCEEESAHSVFVSLAQLYNAILERAAVDCDNAATQSGNTARSSSEINDFGAQLVAEGAKAQASRLAQHFRALKINTGD